jgi:hypothetical protein
MRKIMGGLAVFIGCASILWMFGAISYFGLNPDKLRSSTASWAGVAAIIFIPGALGWGLRTLLARLGKTSTLR